ncbi:MAG: isoprenylcysteine carboxylmethyltransferase family protein [Candidatus Omnitrophica bacterium]|nr:isoprenylcysteine carboxylmethyltransferase family protein [Candidatus Omnitrophota bacterium]
MAENRTTFNLIFFLLVFILGEITLITLFAGIPFIFAGIFVRGIAAGTIKKNISLTTTGPYKICRHPLYFGSFLLSVGLSVISKNFFVFLFFLIFFPLTYIPAILKEENFLIERFGDEYINYKKTTHCFIPSLRKIDRYEFSWKQLKENREYINWIIILLLIAVLLIKSYYVF